MCLCPHIYIPPNQVLPYKKFSCQSISESLEKKRGLHTDIGLSLAATYPDKYDTYTGFSQITNWVDNDKLSYKWLLKRAREKNHQKAIKELTAVGEPPYCDSFKQWTVIRKWQFKFNTMFYDAGDQGSATFYSGLKIMLRSTDYSLIDIYNSLVRGFKLSYSEERSRTADGSCSFIC